LNKFLAFLEKKEVLREISPQTGDAIPIPSSTGESKK